MIRVRILLAADSVVRDASTNRLSVFNIHEQFRPTGFPVLVPRFTVLAVLDREPGDPETVPCRLKIVLEPDVLFDQPVEVNFSGENLTRALMEFQGLLVPRPGALRVAFEVAGAATETYPMPVFLPPQATPPVRLT